MASARGLGPILRLFTRLRGCKTCLSSTNTEAKRYGRLYHEWTCRTLSGFANYESARQRFTDHNVLSSVHACTQWRHLTTKRHGEVIDYQVDPYKHTENELSTLCDDIKLVLETSQPELQEIAQYHFNGEGKAFRPMLVLLMAEACNCHVDPLNTGLLKSQRHIAMIAEMIHTASLVHDDVIDNADTRRGHPSVQQAWGQRKAILVGDYILSIASTLLARIRNDEVIEVLSKVLEDLVKGEFMQLGSKENENERFAHYLEKTFKKTASLIAYSCKAVAILGECSEEAVEIAYQYGRNVGIAFQLVDDLLDFVSCEALMGKPTAADLKLGLATAPVLFAAQQYPELNPMIMRRFTRPGDVQTARDLVAKSDGVSQTRFLAEQHCREAVHTVKILQPSTARDALIAITQKVLNRLK